MQKIQQLSEGTVENLLQANKYALDSRNRAFFTGSVENGVLDIKEVWSAGSINTSYRGKQFDTGFTGGIRFTPQDIELYFCSDEKIYFLDWDKVNAACATQKEAEQPKVWVPNPF